MTIGAGHLYFVYLCGCIFPMITGDWRLFLYEMTEVYADFLAKTTHITKIVYLFINTLTLAPRGI